MSATTTKKLIGLTGAAGSGKSAAAVGLAEKRDDWTRCRLAGPLKDMLHAMGLSWEELDGKLKETPHHLLCGQTPRFAMQTLGTEWGRDLIGQDLWLNVLKDRIKKNWAAGLSVVVDDVRFPNEVAAIRALGGMVLGIERPDRDASHAQRDAHASEQSNASITVDHVIVNDGTILEMVEKIEAVLDR